MYLSVLCTAVVLARMVRVDSGLPGLSTAVPFRVPARAASSLPPRHARVALRASRARSARSPRSAPVLWRVFGVEVPVAETVVLGADYNAVLNVSAVLHRAVAEHLGIQPEALPMENVELVRKSLDARRNRAVAWSHVVDVRLSKAQAQRVKAQPGRIVPAAGERARPKPPREANASGAGASVVVVGAGPCGLFAALELARAGRRVTLLERGKPVEERGRSIGALVRRGVLDGESNFCYGEGGAGTWSDGKLTTRIGRNSDAVRRVLETLVHFGAPPRILVDGKPHLGTDNLVRLLKNFRRELLDHGVTIRWDARADALEVDDGAVTGVRLKSGELLAAEAVVLAAGHSARELYPHLLDRGARLAPKDFAVGFRVEHPQELVNRAQYGAMASLCGKGGKGALPPASYRLSYTANAEVALVQPKQGARGVYSFCMCPGGQIVPTALDKEHLCVNGMSYSNRGSKWANSAVVVSVGEAYGDFGSGDGAAGLAGLRFQEEMEARAARMGGDGLQCPAQRVSDFLAGRVSEDLPPSSYTRGIVPASLHELYPPRLTAALAAALETWGAAMPGFDGDEAVLHGVETRTSAPVQIVRDNRTCECVGIAGLFPAGEGAGYAGGIVSAAVDGLRVAEALLGRAE